nr:PREDICTED: FYVE and coiled-coil domain-containing protein 1 isoform X2 [Lepisosteus oculatus]
MMAASVGESQLQRIIRDLHDAVTELSKEYRESGEPITDDSPNLHKFSYKLEYLLQFDQKEKTTFLGTRKDYWDYFSDCLTKIKGANDGIRFVKSIPEFKTSLGKGRAFIRYSLVHQRLADTLQQCLMNEKVTSDWYYARSPFLKPHLNVDIINHLYELNEVQFDIASRGYDLDAAWPTFARRTLGLANSPSHFWKPPSRSSSISSLVSGYSQAHDIPSSPDFNHTLMSEPTSEVDDLRLELDQSELKQRELQDRIQQLEREKQNLLKASNVQDGLPEHESNLGQDSSQLRKMVEDLQKQLEVALSSQRTVHDLQQCLKTLEDNSSEKQRELEKINKDYAIQLQNFKEDLETVKEHLKAEQEKVSDLKAKVSELKAVSTEYTQQIEEKTAEVSRSELVIQQSNEELERVKESLARAQEALSSAQKESQELSEKLNNLMTEKEKNDLQMSAEIDDLYRTKKNLEERLIELIRDKDALWQKSDALEFEQKLRAEERWLVDKEVNHCLGCQSPFTWWLRRHHCRLCGRIFCYYCSNNFVKTKHSGKKERCCRECYMQHSAVVERLPAAEVASPPETPTDSPKDLGQLPRRLTPSVVVTDAAPKPDDAVFDIITEEEVNGIYDSDSVRDSPDSTREMEGQQRSPEVNAAVGESTPDDLGEQMPTVQDAEICLLKSGELTLTVPLTIETIMQFGEGGRELFIKSSGYSVIPIDVEEAGPTISWVFSSEPKSISFSVVYKESGDSPIEQAKVLIPLTRCNSHKETIQGQLKVRNPGTYMLIFDNSFSRFISKKVLYHLTVEKPIIYDGSDFL